MFDIRSISLYNLIAILVIKLYGRTKKDESAYERNIESDNSRSY